MNIRPYTHRDHPACLAILEDNSPDYFDPSERDQFDQFLFKPVGPYLVLEVNDQIMGCGGWLIDKGDKAVLTWGMVNRQYQGRGLGKTLLRARIKALRELGHVGSIEIETSQKVQGSLPGSVLRLWMLPPMISARAWIKWL